VTQSLDQIEREVLANTLQSAVDACGPLPSTDSVLARVESLARHHEVLAATGEESDVAAGVRRTLAAGLRREAAYVEAWRDGGRRWGFTAGSPPPAG
jgi:hypothetical protein